MMAIVKYGVLFEGMTSLTGNICRQYSGSTAEPPPG
jgi:hypothetical protein